MSFNIDPARLEGLTAGAWAFYMLKAHLVGGIATQVLESAAVVGDETDLKNFNEFYEANKIGAMNPSMTKQVLHDDAVRIIRLELAKPEMEKLIRAKAVEAKAVLFDPYNTV